MIRYAQKATAKASAFTCSGFVAQEVETAAKKLNFEFSGVDKPATTDGLYGLRYDNFVAPLVKAIQELSQQNNELKKELAELRTMTVAGNSTTDKNTALLSGASLGQNNPNPFSGTTSIRYNLPLKYTAAKMVITDNAGRVVKAFRLTGSAKGNLQVDTGMLAAGTYNYSLYTDEKLIGTKQMVIAK